MKLDGQQPHILVVNDSPEILALKREIFEEEGFQVSTRINRDVDLDEIVRIGPNLVILDYSDEAESALLGQLRGDPRTASIPIVLCTGAIRKVEEIRPQIEAMGVRVVYKPFDIEDLVGVVREALDMDSERQETPPPGAA
ncbi:MAG TPA: response regulator [Thermomicrobiales bacterium]|nr:response regulator [Thermomicrobiales bacterium]